ncbi:unnamed protein product [Brassica rapa]|uniref:Uncharacterized protein n=2 Tax=Brassica TaxID=3705 RepID=A0A8D9GR35_BRACM|nr:unnamed protein product [Brassica napus]CAG7885242.1 unnamed protein product [Brassica rapa]
MKNEKTKEKAETKDLLFQRSSPVRCNLTGSASSVASFMWWSSGFCLRRRTVGIPLRYLHLLR